MSGLIEVRGCVAVRRVVAATDLSALQAHAQVHPARADLHALLAFERGSGSSDTAIESRCVHVEAAALTRSTLLVAPRRERSERNEPFEQRSTDDRAFAADRLRRRRDRRPNGSLPRRAPEDPRFVADVREKLEVRPLQRPVALDRRAHEPADAGRDAPGEPPVTREVEVRVSSRSPRLARRGRRWRRRVSHRAWRRGPRGARRPANAAVPDDDALRSGSNECPASAVERTPPAAWTRAGLAAATARAMSSGTPARCAPPSGPRRERPSLPPRRRAR